MGHENDGFWPPTARILPDRASRTSRRSSSGAGSAEATSSSTRSSCTRFPATATRGPRPGETFDVEVVLRNVGTLPPAAAVTATAQAATPYAQMLVSGWRDAGRSRVADERLGDFPDRDRRRAPAGGAARRSSSRGRSTASRARPSPVRLTAGPLVDDRERRVRSVIGVDRRGAAETRGPARGRASTRSGRCSRSSTGGTTPGSRKTTTRPPARNAG